MGWDIALCKDGRPVRVPAHQEGSNIVVAWAPRPVPGVASVTQTGEVWVRAGARGQLEQTAPAVAEALTTGRLVPVAGRRVAEVTVTYNYGKHFDFGDLAGLDAAASMPLLETAVEMLGDDASDDYWQDSSGNAGHMCAVLLEWARAHPDAHWEVT